MAIVRCRKDFQSRICPPRVTLLSVFSLSPDRKSTTSFPVGASSCQPFLQVPRPLPLSKPNPISGLLPNTHTCTHRSFYQGLYPHQKDLSRPLLCTPHCSVKFSNNLHGSPCSNKRAEQDIQTECYLLPHRIFQNSPS